MKVTAKVSPESVTLEMPRPHALVLFEFLSHFEDDGLLEIRDPAEAAILTSLQDALLCQLVEPLAPDYLDRLEVAREKVRRSP